MTVVDSRVKTGKLELSLDGTVWEPYSCQQTNIRIEPAYSESGEAVEVLCGDNLTADATVAWAMKMTSIQDFDNADGLMVFLRENMLQPVHFRFTPNATAEQVTGILQARTGPWYGDVAKRITTDIELPINGTPVWAPQPPPGQ